MGASAGFNMAKKFEKETSVAYLCSPSTPINFKLLERLPIYGVSTQPHATQHTRPRSLLKFIGLYKAHASPHFLQWTLAMSLPSQQRGQERSQKSTSMHLHPVNLHWLTRIYNL